MSTASTRVWLRCCGGYAPGKADDQRNPAYIVLRRVAFTEAKMVAQPLAVIRREEYNRISLQAQALKSR